MESSATEHRRGPTPAIIVGSGGIYTVDFFAKGGRLVAAEQPKCEPNPYLKPVYQVRREQRAGKDAGASTEMKMPQSKPPRWEFWAWVATRGLFVSCVIVAAIITAIVFVIIKILGIR